MSSENAVKIGIVGVGAIGQVLAAALDRGEVGAQLAAIADQDSAKAREFAKGLKASPPVVSIDDLVSRVDLVVEAAGQAALPAIIPKALRAGRDVLVMSVGGLLGRDEWFREAEERGCRIHVPSGAIAGLDGIRAAALGKLNLVVLTSRKPVAALRGARYVVERGIDLDSLKEERVLFEGPPEEACRAFPATSNVAAALRLAAGRSVEVRIRVVAVPGGTENVHEIRASGDFGKLQVVLENVPSPSNPRTSQLAALSAVETLRSIVRAQRSEVPQAEAARLEARA